MKKISLIIPIGPEREFEIKNSLKPYLDKINLIVENGLNPSENRNRGITKAKTELVAFLNAHSILTNDWIKEVEIFFKKHPEIDIVGGPQLTMRSDPLFERASGYALSSIFGAGEVRTRYKTRKLSLDANEKHLTSANLICKRDVFKKIKFDENLWPGEDPKLISDAIKAGFRVAYSPDIIVYQKRRKNLRGLTKQIFNYGFTRTRKEGLIETIKKPFFLVPSLFVIYLLLLPTLTVLNYLLLYPLFLYLIVNIFYSIYENIKNKDVRTIFLMPVIFLAIHVSYGIGFLYGGLTKNRLFLSIE